MPSPRAVRTSTPSVSTHLYCAIASANGTATAWQNLGVLERRRGNFEVSEAHLLEAQRIRRASLPSEHPSHVESRFSLGQLYLDWDRPERARPHLEAYVAYAERENPEGHWGTGNAQAWLGRCLGRVGETDSARPLLERGLRTLRASVGENHSFTRDAVRWQEELRSEESRR